MSIRDKVVDKSGRNVILALFKEFSRSDVKFPWVYTLKQAKQMFLEARDPTEYKFAMELLGDWDHWNQMKAHPLIKPHVEKWQAELEIKLHSEAIAQMHVHARSQGGTAAAKWLADKGYTEPLEKKPKGRPVKKPEQEQDNSVVEEKLASVIQLVRVSNDK